MNHLTEFFLFVVVVLVTQAFFPVFLCSNFIKTIKHQAKNGYGRMFFRTKKTSSVPQTMAVRIFLNGFWGTVECSVNLPSSSDFSMASLQKRVLCVTLHPAFLSPKRMRKIENFRDSLDPQIKNEPLKEIK